MNNQNTGVIYEYETSTELIGLESKYISIPLPLILDNEIDKRRIAVFSYLRSYCGVNEEVNFSLPHLITWCGNKPDRRTNGMDSKYLAVIDALFDRGYFTLLTKISRTHLMTCKFEQGFFDEECKTNRFAIVYLDEIKKIMDYKKPVNDSGNHLLTNSTILLVFAYLRAMIHRRPNMLRLSSGTTIEKRKEFYPEAFNSNFKTICNELDISQKTFTRIINILEDELQLIAIARPYIARLDNGEHRTPDSIFTNTYKREDKYLLANGKDYIDAEVKIKEKNMQKHFKYYKINREK